MNRCTECGHCCVVFNFVEVSKFEAEMRGLRVVEAKEIFPKHKEGEFMLKRKKAFWGAIGEWVYVCEYFDIDTRLCSVYHNRPDICRKYDCGWDQRVQNEWEKLCRGEDALCLSA